MEVSFPILFLSTFLTYFEVSSGELSVPLARMEKARVLHNLWENWISKNPWEEFPVNRTVEGAPCNVPPEETVRFTYYRRLRVTLVKHKERQLSVLSHVAKSLSFYEEHMGTPPVNEFAEFCRFPAIKSTTFQEVHGLLWSPDPYPLMCEAGKCVPCSKVTNDKLQEACNLILPEEEPLEPPSESQKLYETLKSLQNIPSEEEQEEREVAVEGMPCSATPEQTLTYVTLLKVWEHPPRDPRTLEEFEKELNLIEKIEGNLEYYKELFNDFQDALNRKVFCRTKLRAWLGPHDVDKAEYWVKGAYVCGGETCKPCKARPLQVGKQVWNFESGPLHDVCAILTKLRDNSQPQTENGECPPLRPPETCATGRHDTKCKNDEIRTNLDRWKLSKSRRLVSSPLVLVGALITFCFIVTSLEL